MSAMRSSLAIRVFLASALALLSWSPGAVARSKSERVENADSRFAIDIPSSFSASPPPTGSRALHYFTSDGALVASITRFDAANRGAYRKEESSAFALAVVRGLQKNHAGFELHRQKLQRIDRVPVLDLEFSRTNHGGTVERVWMRMLLRYRFTVVATVSIPKAAPKRLRRHAKGFTEALVPWTAP